MNTGFMAFVTSVAFQTALWTWNLSYCNAYNELSYPLRAFCVQQNRTTAVFAARIMAHQNFHRYDVRLKSVEIRVIFGETSAA
jgi:hypothetical protein